MMFDFFWWRRRPPALRRASVADATALATVHAGAFRVAWDALEFERLLTDRLSRAWVVTDGPLGPVVGFLLVHGVTPETEILSIALVPRRRGLGLAHRLIDLAFGELAAEGFTTVFLEVEQGNQPALKLYARHGFREVGRRTGYYRAADGSPATALVMRRDIA